MKKHLFLTFISILFLSKAYAWQFRGVQATVLTGATEDNLSPAFFGDTLNAVIYLQQSITLH